MAAALCGRILELSARIEQDLPAGSAREALRAVRQRLESAATLRLAVGGRLNAGKSTLVNVLLGQRLAATDATECTRIVTWFHYHHQNRIHVRLRDGTSQILVPGPGGTVPADLGHPVDQIADLTVETSNQQLKLYHTLADTPGLDALSGLDEDSKAAMRSADALIYVMPHPGENDRKTLEALQEAFADSQLSAANTVGVLSQIDNLGDGARDPQETWKTARRIASHYATDLRTLLADVIPVHGLLAYAALGADFTEAHTEALRTLAAVPPDDRTLMLYSYDFFLEYTDCPLEAATRRRLHQLLGLYGIRLSLDLIDQGCTATRTLLDELRQRSGIDALLGFLHTNFLASADRLRAAASLTTLERISWTGQTPAEQRALADLRIHVARLRHDPALREVELAHALGELNQPAHHTTTALDDKATDDLVDLVKNPTPASRLGLPDDAPTTKIVQTAEAKADRWRALEFSPSRTLARHARTIREAFEDIAFHSTSATGRPDRDPPPATSLDRKGMRHG
ncbi:hypothetical protein ACM01_03855 [Streptomyces viridochromogenes]|uniref:G domain-containing protein n=1 Tax=Streptomyces viridochromogenes TaxID=1938 RepID=A0A0J7ZNH3_STRVR|nr:dynamin family protein [Streptomyces viridochromogenes]KMS76957.1 hypothetical protein ACM01_03855 [Streptomyces viridochromogenes]